jgi:transcriptional regulator with XRE-family HTH domain
LSAATKAIKDFLRESDIDATLVIPDRSAFEISGGLKDKIERFIKKKLKKQKEKPEKPKNIEDFLPDKERFRNVRAFGVAPTHTKKSPFDLTGKKQRTLPDMDDIIGNLDEPFSETLLRLIDSKRKTDVEVYKRANIDRKLFSKIRSGRGYTPSKKTILALAVALELSLKETEDLLKHAGSALSRSVKFDVIVEYFITNKIYDVYERNNVLFSYDQPLLGF